MSFTCGANGRAGLERAWPGQCDAAAAHAIDGVLLLHPERQHMWCCIRLATVAGLGGASRTWWGGERAWSSGLGRAVERARVPPPRAVQRVDLSVDATTTWTAACVKRAVDLEFWLDQWNSGADDSPSGNMSFRVLIPLSIIEL